MDSNENFFDSFLILIRNKGKIKAKTI